MLGLHHGQRYNTKQKESQVNMFIGSPQNVFPFDKQIYVYLKIQKFSGESSSLKFEVWILKSKIPIQNGCQKIP